MKKAAGTKGHKAKTKKTPAGKQKLGDLDPAQRKAGDVKGGYIVFTGGTRRR